MRSKLILAIALMAIPWAQGEDHATLTETSIPIEREGAVERELPATVTYETWYAGGSRIDFDHSIHAELECAACHHAQSCDACHLRGHEPVDIKVLVRGSQSALHNVCFTCHPQDPGGTNCGVCHTPGSGGGIAHSTKLGAEHMEAFFASLSEDLGQMQFIGDRMPPVREAAEMPTSHVYLTKYDEGSVVNFPHEAHAEDMEISCATCHHFERCGLCHDALQKKVIVRDAQTAAHDLCIRCHDEAGLDTDCDQCHIKP